MQLIIFNNDIFDFIANQNLLQKIYLNFFSKKIDGLNQKNSHSPSILSRR